MILNKEAEAIPWGGQSSTNGAGKTGHPHGKEQSRIPTSHHIQKLTQNIQT